MSKYMEEATNNSAFAKVGIYGDAGSGKSRTAAEVAIGLHKFIKSTKPVAMFDTEPGHVFLLPLFKKAGIKLLAFDKSRSFVDLMGWAEEARDTVDIAIVDSISHVWRELQSAYLAKINESRPPHKQITRLEFQHWGPIKKEWGRFTDLFLTSKMHMVVCGRAGSIYEYQENDQGKKELITTGTKMATEKEMGYEPSLLVEMIKDHRKDGDKRIVNMCIVEKDRADLLNGKEFDFPNFDTFKPHFQFLNIGGEHFTMESGTSKDLFTPDGNDGWTEEKRRRVILCEEIQGLLVKHIPGQAAADKQRKVELLEKYFSTKSWTKVESMKSEILHNSYIRLLSELEPGTQPITGEPLETITDEESAALNTEAAHV
jgi:hypothetical protein